MKGEKDGGTEGWSEGGKGLGVSACASLYHHINATHMQYRALPVHPECMKRQMNVSSH